MTRFATVVSRGRWNPAIPQGAHTTVVDRFVWLGLVQTQVCVISCRTSDRCSFCHIWQSSPPLPPSPHPSSHVYIVRRPLELGQAWAPGDKFPSWGDQCAFNDAACPLNSNQFELRGHVAATKQRYTPVKRKVASCELFMRHVPATLRKINHSENEITAMSLRQDPPYEHFKKPIPATCPFVWTAHEILPRDMSLQHFPSSEPTQVAATCPLNSNWF